MKNLLKFKARAIIYISILFISIVSTVSAQKIAIIDAGSSRLWVYEVKVNKDEIKIDTLFNAKGPTLSTVALDENSINEFLKSMGLEKSRESGNTIPLYILATAGMRIYFDNNYKEKAEEKATEFYNYMKGKQLKINHDNKPFIFNVNDAMTISGQYEGLYAWIAANFKAENLIIKNGELAINNETQGILEIGGASMQVAFAAKKKSDMTIERLSLNIYSKSYLHYGADRIFEQFRLLRFTDMMVPLDKIDSLYAENMKFVGLSNPIKYRDQNLTDANRGKDSYANYHPALNNKYIEWVLKQLNLKDKPFETNSDSDWTLGAALDILINGKDPKPFDYKNPN